MSSKKHTHVKGKITPPLPLPVVPAPDGKVYAPVVDFPIVLPPVSSSYASSSSCQNFIAVGIKCIRGEESINLKIINPKWQVSFFLDQWQVSYLVKIRRCSNRSSCICFMFSVYPLISSIVS
jgi:hypothetical protein